MDNNEQNISTLQDTEKFNAMRENLYKIVTQAKKETTPKKYRKLREDGFEYVDYAYMKEQMDKWHPHRAEVVTFQLDEKLLVIHADAIVTDLQTRETRTGTDSHRIAMKKGWQSESDLKANPLRAIIDIGNDRKAAKTEALRNAYADFGICADVYRRQLAVPVSDEQEQAFSKLSEDAAQYLNTGGLLEWWKSIIEGFKQQTMQSADEYITNVQANVNKLKERREQANASKQS